MKTLTYPVLAAAVFFAGCSQDTSESTVADEAVATPATVAAENLCLDAGPQTPRDISNKAGLNLDAFPMAPAAGK